MDFYFNHNKLQEELKKAEAKDGTPQICTEFYELVSKSKDMKEKICVMESWKNQVYLDFSGEYRKYYLLFASLQKTGNFPEVCDADILNLEEVEPRVSSKIVRMVLSCCARDSQNVFVSLEDDEDTTDAEYTILLTGDKVINLIGIEKYLEYHIYHPVPNDIKELFDKVYDDCNDIVFTDKAKETAKKRESAYREFGFCKMLKIFYGMKELLLPFYREEMPGISELMIFEKFKEEYGVEISPDTRKTMEMYGNLREVKIDETIYRMTNHIKIPVQESRIYFKYIEGKIYIGHSGEHLRTASDR